MSSTSRIRRRWTEHEDQLLRKEANFQSKLPGRTNKDCRKRWAKVCENIKKGAWDSAEDERLQNAVQFYGPRWTQVAQMVGTRHGDQCAKRWQHSLDPNVDHSQWRVEDDKRLMTAVESYGRNWTTVREKEFPARSTTELKNRHSILVGRRKHVPESSTATSPTADMDSDHDSNSEEDESSNHLEGSEGVLDSSPMSDVFTTLADQSVLSMTASVDSEMALNSLIDLGLDPGAVEMEEFDHFAFPTGSDDLLAPMFLDETSSSLARHFDQSITSTNIPFLPNSPESLPPASSRPKDDAQDPPPPPPHPALEPAWRTTLTLHNAQPETLNSIMQILIQSRTKVTLETHQ